MLYAAMGDGYGGNYKGHSINQNYAVSPSTIGYVE
jgi:hypothetical protein